jgi:fibro-slime domain-containing protein
VPLGLLLDITFIYVKYLRLEGVEHMMRILKNKLLSLSLALVLIMTSSIGVYADNEDKSSSTTPESQTEIVLGEGQGENNASEGDNQMEDDKESNPEEEPSQSGKENPENKDNPENPDLENPDGKDVENPENPDKENPENPDEENPEKPDEENPDQEKPDETEIDPEKEEILETKELSEKLGDYNVTATIEADTFEADDVALKLESVGEGDLSEMLAAVKASYTSKVISASAAFDISFVSGEEKVQPKEGKSVQISISGLDFTADKVFHFSNNESYTQVGEGNTFSASEFSPFLFVAFSEPEFGTDSVLYKDSAYGSCATEEKHLENTRTVFEVADKDSYAVRVHNYNIANSFATIAPARGNRCFIYGSDNDSDFTFHFKAPENYYIDYVGIAGANPRDVKGIQKPSGKYQTSFDATLKLDKIGRNYKVNEVVIGLLPIPVEWDGNETTSVSGATFVNYKNNANNLGSEFLFNDGKGTGSNNCYYEQVYQGLAANILDITAGGFKLAVGNSNEAFPNADTYEANRAKYDKYITDYRSDASVLFRKDKQGYWTIDSASSRYELNSDNELAPVSGKEQFRPFGNDDHFAMYLPIKFSVNSDGKTNGNPTVFKFSGDDDVFVYVDGKLVLDLGGIHDIIRGQINFQTGDVLIQGDYNSKLTSSIDNTVYQKKGMGNTNLYKVLGTSLSSFSKDEHTLTVIYFERGGNLSNCRISYNFNKDEPVDVEFEGLKVDKDSKPLAGAEFRLFEDAECKTPILDGSGNPKKAVSDAKGTIKFTDLSIGVLTSTTAQINKTFYMKETEAPSGYRLPENAVWKLDITAKTGGVTSKSLTAVTEDAKKISITDGENSTNVKAIKNIEKQPGKLVITKKLEGYYKTGGTATFAFEVYYKIGDKEYSKVYPLSFTGPGTQSVEAITIPCDAVVTVTEVYSGGSYDLKSAEIVSGVGTVTETKMVNVKIEDNKTSEVKFVNDYNYHDIYGSISITNIFDRIKNLLFRKGEAVIVEPVQIEDEEEVSDND